MPMRVAGRPVLRLGERGQTGPQLRPSEVEESPQLDGQAAVVSEDHVYWPRWWLERAEDPNELGTPWVAAPPSKLRPHRVPGDWKERLRRGRRRRFENSP